MKTRRGVLGWLATIFASLAGGTANASPPRLIPCSKRKPSVSGLRIKQYREVPRMVEVCEMPTPDDPVAWQAFCAWLPAWVKVDTQFYERTGQINIGSLFILKHSQARGTRIWKYSDGAISSGNYQLDDPAKYEYLRECDL